MQPMSINPDLSHDREVIRDFLRSLSEGTAQIPPNLPQALDRLIERVETMTRQRDRLYAACQAALIRMRSECRRMKPKGTDLDSWAERQSQSERARLYVELRDACLEVEPPAVH